MAVRRSAALIIRCMGRRIPACLCQVKPAATGDSIVHYNELMMDRRAHGMKPIHVKMYISMVIPTDFELGKPFPVYTHKPNKIPYKYINM